MTMTADEADYILRDAMHVRYNVKTKQEFNPTTDMYKVSEWLKKHNIEPKENDVIDVYLDEE